MKLSPHFTSRVVRSEARGGLGVEKLWMSGANPVENRTFNIFFLGGAPRITAKCGVVDEPFALPFA
jgi:hypothetical protein